MSLSWPREQPRTGDSARDAGAPDLRGSGGRLVALVVIFAATTSTSTSLVSSSGGAGVMAWSGKLYAAIGPTRLSVMDLLLIACAVGLVLSRRLSSPRVSSAVRRSDALAVWITFALLATVVQGIVLGLSAHASAVFVDAKGPVYLALVPWLVRGSLRGEGDFVLLQRAILWLALFQSLVGILNVLLGVGVLAGDQVLAFADGTPIFVVVFGAFQAAVLLLRGQRDLLAMAVLPLSIVALILSQRRSFLLAAIVIGLLLLLFAFIHRRGAVLILATALLAAGVLVGLSGHVPTIVESGRGSSLSQVHTVIGDLYRSAERTNILQNLKRSPVVGLGFGVPWVQFSPLPGYFVGYLEYTHVGYLWYWLKIGLVGLLCYLALMALAIWSGVTAVGRTPARLQPLILASCAMLGVELIVEGTATFSGVDTQYTFMLAVTIGVVMAARARFSAGAALNAEPGDLALYR